MIMGRNENIAIFKDTEKLCRTNRRIKDVRFNFHAVSEVQLPEGIKLKMPEIHYVDNFYVMEDVNAEGVVKVNRYESLDEAMQEYLRLPNHQEKVLGIQNTETKRKTRQTNERAHKKIHTADCNRHNRKYRACGNKDVRRACVQQSVHHA